MEVAFPPDHVRVGMTGIVRREAVAGLLVALAWGCTSTAPTITRVRSTDGDLRPGVRVAVLPFAGSAEFPDAGRLAREVATDVLAADRRATIVPPSVIETYQRTTPFTPSDHDRQALQVAGTNLDAEVLLWGSVNQFTPYRFDRWAPATPPYLELTLFVFRVGQQDVARVTGHTQGSLPSTIWSRQPTFEDVARPLIVELLNSLDP